MNPKSIIEAFPKKIRPDVETDLGTLRVSEFFFDSIQGEGFYIGHPAAFLRLQGCTLNCVWCDTREVWRTGNLYTVEELITIIGETALPHQLEKGQHLVITGGSPLLQQEVLIAFFNAFDKHFGFRPFIEMENECVIYPKSELIYFVACWNNSPKLYDSLQEHGKRFRPGIIQTMAALPNSWFKFVISAKDWEDQWLEINTNFLEPELIGRDQVILMPQGATRKELAENRLTTINLAIHQGVRYCTREHIVIWDNKIGV